MPRWLPPLLALLALAGLAWLLRVVQRFDPGRPLDSAYQTAGLGEVSLRLAGASIISRSQGRRLWHIRADRIDLLRVPGAGPEEFRAAEFHVIRAGTLYRDGRAEATFSAKSAVFDQHARQFAVRGRIRVGTPRGDRLESEELIWSEQDDFVRFPAGTRGIFRRNRLAAPSLVFSPRRRMVQCPQGAEGVFAGYPVRATQLYWDLEKEIVDCPGPVSGERRGIAFSASRATLDLRRRLLKANKGTLIVRIRGDTELPEDLR